MEKIRWYDKNPDLKEIFEFIKQLDKQVQNEIAHDILQILMNDITLNLDEKLNKISTDYNYECKRWYDENIDLFSSFEIIKELPEFQKRDVINKIIQTVLLMYLENNNG